MTTNWKAMQVIAVIIEKGAPKAYVRPGDVLTRGLSMGSWHANGAKGGVFENEARSASKGAGKCKIRITQAPPGGWTTETLAKACRF